MEVKFMEKNNTDYDPKTKPKNIIQAIKRSIYKHTAGTDIGKATHREKQTDKPKPTFRIK